MELKVVEPRKIIQEPYRPPIKLETEWEDYKFIAELYATYDGKYKNSDSYGIISNNTSLTKLSYHGYFSYGFAHRLFLAQVLKGLDQFILLVEKKIEELNTIDEGNPPTN